MINKKEFANRLCSLRNEVGLSQNKLAMILGVSGQAISKWENEHSLPDIDLIPLISNALNVSIDYLLLGKKTNTDSTKLNKSLLTGFDLPDKSMDIVAALSDGLPRNKVYQLSKLLEDEKLKFTFEIGIENDENICLNQNVNLNNDVLKALSPQIIPLVNKVLSYEEAIPDNILSLLRCPKCGESLNLNKSENRLECIMNHRYSIIDNVIDFGYREQDGNCWSYCYKTYEEYEKWNKNYDPITSRPKSRKCLETLVHKFIDKKPSIFVDAGTGEGMGIRLLLKVINWPCTVILTDLSHRILRYNKRLLEEMSSNPYVTMVYLACDLRNVPFIDESVDVVWSFAGFGNMGPMDLLKGVEESHRILNRGGSTILDLYSMQEKDAEDVDTWLEILEKKHPDMPKQKYQEYIKTTETWNELFTNMGYSKNIMERVQSMFTVPNDLIFPWENEVMKWTETSVAVCTK